MGRFGTWLQEARTAQGLTETDLARRSGVSQQNISRLERHGDGVKLETVKALASALGRPYAEALVALLEGFVIIEIDALGPGAADELQLALRNKRLPRAARQVLLAVLTQLEAHETEA